MTIDQVVHTVTFGAYQDRRPCVSNDEGSNLSSGEGRIKALVWDRARHDGGRKHRWQPWSRPGITGLDELAKFF